MFITVIRTAAVLALLAGGTACGSEPDKSEPTGVDELTIPTPDPDPGDFVDGVDNPYLPLAPGSVWRYRAVTEDGVEHNVVTVTDKTRVVAGVTCVVVHDVVRADGEVTEDTYDWFAQDADGNVWYFGEDSTAYEDGKASKEGSWEAGVDGAQAGVAMLAEPRVGDGYAQEYLKGVAEDHGEVLATDASLTIGYGDFDNLVQTRDTTPLEPDIVEQKFYAEGIGVIAEKTVQGGKDTSELVSFTSGD